MHKLELDKVTDAITFLLIVDSASEKEKTQKRNHSKKPTFLITLQEAKSHREKELKTAEEEVKKSKKKAEESTKNMKAKQQVISFAFIAEIERYDLVKIKSTESEAEYQFHL